MKQPVKKRTKPVSTSATEDETPRKKPKMAADKKAKASKARSASVVESEEDGDDESDSDKRKVRLG
jgi:hypothetical protein